MKNTCKLLLASLFACILLITASCKKYPDGPWLSLRTKEHRLAGDWTVEYFAINGYDSTDYLKSQPLYGFYTFLREKEGFRDFGYNSFGDYGTDTSKYYSAAGTWQFINDKGSIEIHSKSAHRGKHFNIGAFAADDVIWEIRRLKEKELWLKTTYTDGREYFVKFSQKAN